MRMGMMGSLGHGKAFGQLLKVRVRGVLAWFVRRTYYLLQMPGWGRRLGIMIDWTFALLFHPDTVKISLDSEAALILREVAAGDAPMTGAGSAAVPAAAPPSSPRRQAGREPLVR
jgi:NADH dehydrogenase